MNIDELVTKAIEVGFEDVHSIRDLARMAVHLQPVDSETEPAHFGSRLGGLPALPVSQQWPHRNGRSLSFIGQVALGLQPRCITKEGFPGRGLLLFFYDVEQFAWGFDPRDADCFTVIHVPNPGSELTISQWPADLSDNARFISCNLSSGRLVATLPPEESILVEGLGLYPEQRDAYLDLLESISNQEEWALRTLLGGYPDQIQGDMMVECELVANGLYCGDGSAYEDERMPTFRRQACDWRLLFQVPSVEEAGMMWGDQGCLYYWIRDEDLHQCRFDRSWMILQCG